MNNNYNIDILNSYNVNVASALELWGDIASYNDALREFKDTLNSKLASLEDYKEKKDWNNYSILVHSMKSEAKYLGFMNEAEVFYKHEMESKANNITYIENNFNDVKTTTLKIIDIIKKYFGEEASKKKLLIADDSNIILNFLDKNLKNEFEIIKANSGESALLGIKENDLYAILLDLNMPGLDGFEVLKYLQDNKLIDSIPIVIITGDDTEDTIKKAFSYPILDVLNKPFNEKNIERILDSIKRFYS